MDTYMHKTIVSVASLEKIEIIRSSEFMPSEARLKFLTKWLFQGLKLPFWGLNFCRILVLGPHFWWSGGPGPWDPPGSTPATVWWGIWRTSFHGRHCSIIYQWQIQDFPLGGTNPLGGHWPLTHTLFGKNVCENERNGSCLGACAGGPPLDLPMSIMFNYPCLFFNDIYVMIWKRFWG